MRMLVPEDPSAQLWAFLGWDEGRRGRRRQQVEGGEDEEAEGQAGAVITRVVVREPRAEAALPVPDMASCVKRRIVEHRGRGHGGCAMSVGHLESGV
ncbi:hypothetical protein RRF57_011261 [Xylaria bambusicola]|uniref:Uncharacterized protein n=1 Tax=Xylaria bambusicola TaxID=326684 RepID=A0AAN7V2G5_9PEZI